MYYKLHLNFSFACDTQRVLWESGASRMVWLDEDGKVAENGCIKSQYYNSVFYSKIVSGPLVWG